jgi:guanylate kinase
MLFDKYPSFFGFSVSHTTRAPRPGEEDGIHYYFTTVDAMKTAIDQNQFIEHAQVHTNFYGTSYEAVNRIKEEGRICVLDIDIQGVENVKKSMLECKYIFIAPPTMDDLESRLRGRGTETDDKISIRLENAKKELEYGLEEGNFDAVIVNDTLQNSFIRLLSFLEQFYGEYGFQSRAEDVTGGGGETHEDDEEEEENKEDQNVEAEADEEEDT